MHAGSPVPCHLPVYSPQPKPTTHFYQPSNQANNLPNQPPDLMWCLKSDGTTHFETSGVTSRVYACVCTGLDGCGADFSAGGPNSMASNTVENTMAFMNLTEATAVQGLRQGLRHHFGPSPTYIRALYCPIRAVCGVICLVPVLIGCLVVLAIRCWDQFTSSVGLARRAPADDDRHDRGAWQRFVPRTLGNGLYSFRSLFLCLLPLLARKV